MTFNFTMFNLMAGTSFRATREIFLKIEMSNLVGMNRKDIISEFFYPKCM